MWAESRARLAAALAAFVPAEVAVVDHPPETQAPPFVYLAPARQGWRQGGLLVSWDVSLVIDGGLAPATRAVELDRLLDLVLAAAAEVSVLAEVTTAFGSQLIGDIGHPRATVTVPLFHAACELPDAAPALTVVR